MCEEVRRGISENHPHTATNVTYAENPLCPINPIGRKGDRMAGFLTYALSPCITFLSFLSGI